MILYRIKATTFGCILFEERIVWGGFDFLTTKPGYGIGFFEIGLPQRGVGVHLISKDQDVFTIDPF